MKKGWKIKKLGDIIALEYGKPLTEEKRITEGKYPIYGANGIKGRTNEYYHNKKSIIVGRKGSAGEVNLTEDKFWPLDVTYYIKYDESKYFLKFLYYLLKLLELPKLAKGVKPGINRNDVYAFRCYFPMLTEQKQIANILDETFEAIDKAKANAQRNLENAKELFESYLESIFKNKGDGWEERKLCDVFELRPMKKEARDKLKETDLVTFLPMEDLGILNKEIVGIKERQLKDVVRCYTYFAVNDVLLAKITPCFENGKIGIARKLINGIGFGSSEYFVFRSKGYIKPDYLYYFLSQTRIRNEGKKYMGGAVGHKRLSKDWIENYIIPFPKSLKEQVNIIKTLDSISAEAKKLEANYQKIIEDLEELKKSMLQKAFNGELETYKELAQ